MISFICRKCRSQIDVSDLAFTKNRAYLLPMFLLLASTHCVADVSVDCSLLNQFSMANSPTVRAETMQYFGVQPQQLSPAVAIQIKAQIDACAAPMKNGITNAFQERQANSRIQLVPPSRAQYESVDNLIAKDKAVIDQVLASIQARNEEVARQQAIAQCMQTPRAQLYQMQEKVIYDEGNLAGAREALDYQHRVSATSGVRNLSDERFIGEQIVMFTDLSERDFKTYKAAGGQAPIAKAVSHDLQNPCVPGSQPMPTPAAASATTCDPPRDAPALYPRVSYQVINAKRVQFFTAPNEVCVQKDVFVVNGDNLIAYAEIDKWLEVGYVTKKGELVMGWIKDDHVKPVGTASPDYNHQ